MIKPKIKIKAKDLTMIFVKFGNFLIVKSFYKKKFKLEEIHGSLPTAW